MHPSAPKLYVTGIDLGSTSLKLLVAGGEQPERVYQVPTPWLAGPGGTTSISADGMQRGVAQLLTQAAAELPPGAKIDAIAVAGMGETGFLVDSDSRAVTQGYAWFDPRGQDCVAAFPEELRREFAGRTGLPWGVQVSTAKLLDLRAGGLNLAGLRWASLPEWLVAQLGGALVAEYSLASRTGLIDQQSGRPWPELLAYLGVEEGFLPELVRAGADLGQVTAGWAPEPFQGAALTVAGHDHLVAAVSGGAGADAYHVSMGTAEVLLRFVESPLTFEARSRLAERLINCVRHVVGGQFVLVAGVKTGLIMRRTLQLLGISGRDGLAALDAEVMALTASQLPPGAIEVSGARNDDGVLKLTVRSDDLTPAELFNAVLEHGNAELNYLIEAIQKEGIEPASSTLLTGGWAELACVRRARSRVLPSITTSERAQETAAGAVLFAKQLIQEPI